MTRLSGQRPRPGGPPRIERLGAATEDAAARARAEAVRAGLTRVPKEVPPAFFYDDRGSELFERITRLPEYYLTQAETEILAREAGAIVAAARPAELLELGSGSSTKTRLLLDALSRVDGRGRYVALDVSPAALEPAADALARDYPSLEILGLVGDLERDLPALPPPPAHGARLVAFLGSTIGNFPPAPRRALLARIAAELRPEDGLLLGTDLVKDPAVLRAAYDDAAGVTAQFNLNLLSALNRELRADFDPGGFAHVAVWNAVEEWIEMRLRARRAMTVRVAALDLEVEFAAGEELRTELSAKFRRARVEQDLAAAGLALAAWWTDGAGRFALSLARPAVRPPAPAAARPA